MSFQNIKMKEKKQNEDSYKAKTPETENGVEQNLEGELTDSQENQPSPQNTDANEQVQNLDAEAVSHAEIDNVIQFDEAKKNIENRSPDQEDDDYDDADIVDEDTAEQDPSFLPGPLVEYRFKKLLLVGGIALGSVFLAILAKNVSFLVLMVGSVYYGYEAFMVAKKYHKGEILEVPVVCTAVKAAQFRNQVSVTFVEEDEEENMHYYKFSVPDKRAEENFVVNAPYVIYFDISNPSFLMAYVLI